jgi:hypothetical protein
VCPSESVAVTLRFATAAEFTGFGFPLGPLVILMVSAPAGESVKEIVLPAALMLEISSPPALPVERKLDGFVLSLMAVLPTVLLKLARDGLPSEDKVPPGR